MSGVELIAGVVLPQNLSWLKLLSCLFISSAFDPPLLSLFLAS